MGLESLASKSNDGRNEPSQDTTDDGSDEKALLDDEPDGEVELYISQIDYTVVEDAHPSEAILHIFGRTPDGELEHVKVYNFQPYFYTEAGQYEPSALNNDEFHSKEGMYESIRGTELERVYTQTPRGTGQIRDDFEHYEADILFPNRFMLDKGITSGVCVPERRGFYGSLIVDESEVEPSDVDGDIRVSFIDIEVDDRNGFPEDGEEEIISITGYDSFDEEYVFWLYDPPEGYALEGDSIDEYEWVHEEQDVDYRQFGTEGDMMFDFLNWMDETDPDVLTGWNFDDFDAPYIVDRLQELDDQSDYDLSFHRLSRVNEVWRSGWGGPDLKGRVVFDLLYAYKRTKFTELDSYRLEDVAQKELGVGKQHHAGRVGDLWVDDCSTLIQYNLRDVELLVELNRRQGIIPFWDEVRSFVGCKLEDSTTPGDACDMYVLHKSNGRFVLPSKKNNEGEEYEGGEVFEPISGVRKNVSVLDLKSLYPMSMVTINASPETKVPKDWDGETYRAPNGVHFRKDEDGIIREMVDELLEEREQKKSLRGDFQPGTEEYEKYDRQQAAVKVIMNSLYGVLGWDKFRLYDREMGAAVTATGRDVIKYTGNVVTRRGNEVIYGDTDSVMVELGGDISITEALDESMSLVTEINQSYKRFAQEELNAEEHRFQIEFEKLYRRFYQAGKKKRYAGHIVWKEGKQVDDVDITGFESERSDTPPMVRKTQVRVLEMLVKDVDHDEIRDYVRDVYESYINGEYDPGQVGKPSGIGQALDEYETEGVHIIGAKVANALLGTNLGGGSKPKRVILDSPPQDLIEEARSNGGITEVQEEALENLFRRFRSTNKKDPAICFEDSEQLDDEIEINWEEMAESTLRGPIERVLNPVGIGWDETIANQQQVGLDQW